MCSLVNHRRNSHVLKTHISTGYQVLTMLLHIDYMSSYNDLQIIVSILHNNTPENFFSLLFMHNKPDHVKLITTLVPAQSDQVN